MAQGKMTLEDWLDDLCVRFIINLPGEDLSSVARICFQIEEAHWFYEDFIRPLDPGLPSMTPKSFSLKMFQHCPLLASFSTDTHLLAFEQFMEYKTRVPVRGAILLNEAMDAVVLVRGYKKGASWSFPRGKINKNEDDVDCAAREVYEETGYDLRSAGLVDKDTPAHPLEVTMHDQQVRLYVFRGIPEDTIFETRTRKEIGDIRWYNLSDLPTYKKKKGAAKNQPPSASSQEKFYMVAPFMGQLKQWITKQKKLDAQNLPAHAGLKQPQAFLDDLVTDDNMLQEPLPQASSPHKLPGSIDKATKELRQLLRVQPPTHGLQLPSPASSQDPGHALLSILQPKMANTGFAPEHGHGQPQIPRVRELGGVPQPSTIGHHHQAQGVPAPGYAIPPSYPAEPNMGPGHPHHPQYSEHRPRPRVFITDEIPQHGHLKPSSHELHNPPVQLLHPQPLPPQVQKKMLLHNLHDMVSSPNASGAANQHAPPGMPQGFHVAPPNAQFQQYRPQVGGNLSNHPSPLGPHPANLLNVLKGENIPPSAQQSASHSSPLNGNTETQTKSQYQGQRIPASEAGFAGPFGAMPMSSTAFPTATMQAPAPFSGGGVRPVVPTDQHRVSLLGMFKTGKSTLSQSQVDGQSPSFQPAVPQTTQMDSPKQPEARHGPPAIDVSRTTARANGQPTHNLPYGSQTILRRDSKQGSTRSPALSTRNTNETTTHLPVRSHPSPTSSRDRISPHSQLSPYQKYLHAKVQSPAAAPSYPYGGSQGGVPGDETQAGSPTASTILPSVTVKPRQNSSVEHKKALLSIFGKSQMEAEQGKGKEPARPEPVVGAEPLPRSRVASFASQASRRSSTAPLSAADRNFLLDFLENASHNVKD